MHNDFGENIVRIDRLTRTGIAVKVGTNLQKNSEQGQDAFCTGENIRWGGVLFVLPIFLFYLEESYEA